MAKTIYIAGLGLIGASMALGIKRDHPDYEILGYNRSQASRDIALERGMIDRATDNFASFAPLADIIILSLPIQQTLDFIEKLASLDLKEGVIISDAGSTSKSSSTDDLFVTLKTCLFFVNIQQGLNEWIFHWHIVRSVTMFRKAD